MLSSEVHARGIYPPVDPLQSLSRLMRKGAGPGRTRQDHLDVSAQLLAALAKARQVGELADLVGAETLSSTDRQYLQYASDFERVLLDQGRSEDRSLEDTLGRAWRVRHSLPRRELAMRPEAMIDRYLPDESAGRPAGGGSGPGSQRSGASGPGSAGGSGADAGGRS